MVCCCSWTLALAIGGIVALVAFTRKWIAGGVNRWFPDLKGKLVVITGSTSGIGTQTALQLAKLNASLVLADRDLDRSEAMKKELLKYTSGSVECIQCDLADIESVKSFGTKFLAKYEKCDILLNNAGVMMCPLTPTKQGFEMQIGTNHLGHFVLTNSILPALLKAKGRVVSLSSMGHFMAPLSEGIDFDRFKVSDFQTHTYNSGVSYGMSKLANILFTKELVRRYGSQGLTAYALHPGVVRTPLDRHFNPVTRFFYFLLGRLITKSAFEGAQTSLHCALAPTEKLVSGGYYSDCALKETSKHARNEELSRKLWEVSCSHTGIPL